MVTVKNYQAIILASAAPVALGWSAPALSHDHSLTLPSNIDSSLSSESNFIVQDSIEETHSFESNHYTILAASDFVEEEQKKTQVSAEQEANAVVDVPSSPPMDDPIARSNLLIEPNSISNPWLSFSQYTPLLEIPKQPETTTPVEVFLGEPEPIQVAGLTPPILENTEQLALIQKPTEAANTTVAEPSNSTEEKKDMVFNTSFLRGGANINLDDLLNSGVLPGQYEVLVAINGQPLFNKLINFDKNKRTNLVEACISLDLLTQMGVDTPRLIAEKKIDPTKKNDCLDLPLIMDKAFQKYNSERFRLLVSIPQIYVKEKAMVYADPSSWDYGVTALSSQYTGSYNQSWNQDAASTSNFSSSLRNRANVLGWRLYNTGSLSYNQERSLEYSSFSLYAEHDVDFLKAQLRVGDVYASARGLDGVGIRGVQITDDLGMQPGTVQTFRPSVRGQAETSSTVEIRQQGFLIYTTNVPPGPFELRDIPNVASDGDLEVTVIGADGRRLVTVQPWISGANILNPGFFTYTATVGEYNNYSSNDNSGLRVGSLDYQYGLNEYLSLSGGSQVASGYFANAISFATATPIGPISLDTRHSVSTVDGKRTTGGGIGLTYSKAYDPYGLTFALASQRFTSQGYRSLSEHAVLKSANGDSSENNNIKLTSSVSINKYFENRRWGSFYLTLADTQYWNNSNSSSSLSFGYNNSFQKVNYGVSGTYTKNVAAEGGRVKDSKGLLFNVSIPLGSDDYPIRVNASYATGSGFDSNQSISKTGDFFLSTQQFNYTAYVNGNHKRLDTIGANLSTSTSFGNYHTALTRSSRFTNLNVGGSGGVVLHAGGLNFTSNVSDSLALVKVGNESGVQVGNSRTGFNGFAVVPVSPYQNNQILVGKDLDSNIDLVQDTGINVVPRRDAIVYGKFDTVTGRRVEFTIKTDDNQRAPFGTILLDDQGNRLGVTDPFGKALVLLKENAGSLKIDFGSQSCTASFELPPLDPELNFEKQTISCLPSSTVD